MKKAVFYFLAPIIILINSCTGEKVEDVQTQAVSAESNFPEENTAGHIHAPEAANQKTSTNMPLMTKEGLPKELVCMVNNAYMGKKQFPVKFEEKQYYGCCEMCVKTIQNERQVRVALDPLTRKEIDKADAFIALHPGSVNREVLYFESEANYIAFIGQH